ncbi:MAG TPA: tetratricopeptide repeat protein, partial [Acetobacteraceae bacterium]
RIGDAGRIREPRHGLGMRRQRIKPRPVPHVAGIAAKRRVHPPQRLDQDHPDVARDLSNLAQLLQATNRLGEAEPLMCRALAIDEASLGEDHPDVAIDLNNLARLLQATNRLGEAEPLMRRALAIFLAFQRDTGHTHPHRDVVIANYRRLLAAMRRSEAETDAALWREAGVPP